MSFILNDSETYLYVKNLQGDIIAIVDELGEVIVEYSYDAWGNVTFSESSLQNMTKASTLCFVSPFTYRGYCYDYDIELYYLHSRYYSAEIGRFINADSTDYLGYTGTVLSFNLFSYCENNPVMNVDFTGTIAANIVGAVIGAVIGAVGGYFLAKWLAGKISFKYTWQRNAFIGGLTALVTASAAAIGYFVGPYVAKAWSVWSAKLSGLIKGTFKSIAKITTKKMSHINVSKHLWGKVMKKVTTTQIQTIIHQGIRKGTWNLLSNGSVKILYKYSGQIIVITGKVVNNIFQIGDAWVWNGIGSP